MEEIEDRPHAAKWVTDFADAIREFRKVWDELPQWLRDEIMQEEDDGETPITEG